MHKTDSSLRVLVVDDHRDAVEIMSVLLGALGFTTRGATTGASALRQVECFDPDVVLLDLGLPDMSGFEVASFVRSRVGRKCPYLVAVTGWGSVEWRARSRAAGFDRHLLKPMHAAKLQEVMSSAVAHAAPHA